MSTDNKMDPGDVPAYLPVLTQVEKIIFSQKEITLIQVRVRRKNQNWKMIIHWRTSSSLPAEDYTRILHEWNL
jgi:hypothetical protein